MSIRCLSYSLITDDSDVIFKKRRINVIDDSVSDINIHDTSDISKYIMIMENEFNDRGNLFQFVEKLGSQYHLSVS